jgi:hypothetical protein
VPLHPPPNIADGLGLITQQLQRTDSSVISEVTFALAVGAPGTLAKAQDAVDDFQAAFVAMYAPLADTACQILPATIRLGDGSNAPFEAVAAGATTNGSNSSAMAPPQVACLVKKSTGVAGRKNRGRTYFPYMLQTTAINETGTISSGTLTAFQASLDTFMSTLGTDSQPMVIANKVFNTPLPPHYVTDINQGPGVTSYKVEPLVATQRRRLGR